MPQPLKALLSFRIGGVQQLIDNARTTEDFWARSYLVSHLAATTVSVVRDSFAGELVFPAPDVLTPGRGSTKWIGRVPNGVLAVVNLDSAAAAAKSMTHAFDDEWRKIAGAVREKVIQTGLLSKGALATWDRRAGQPTFESFWAYVPISGTYEQAYHEVSRQIEARKILRNFSLAVEHGPKCSLCGLYSALAGSRSEAHETLRIARSLRYRFRGGERLCMMCITCRLAKRVFFDAPDLIFQSTSSIAVAPFRRRVSGNLALKPAADMLAESIKRLGPQVRAASFQDLDGDWFFDSSYEPAKAEREFGVINARELEAAKTSFAAFKRAYEDANIPAPSGYFALLSADGDEVGKLINATVASASDCASHQTLSQRLSGIPSAVQPILESEHTAGSLVYSGGDDVLALLPASTALAALAPFIAAVQEPGVMGWAFSMSASLLIIPHSDSLSGAIRESARILRNDAKNRYGRRCIVLSIRRTSGQMTSVPLPWQAGDSSPLVALQTIVSAMAASPGTPGALSPRLAGRFAEVLPGLLEMGDEDLLQIEKMALYLLRRQTAASKGSPELTALEDAVRALFTASCEIARRDKAPPASRWQPATLLCDILLVARFLSRMTEDQ